MAIYIPINEEIKEVKDIYIEINGEPKRVLTGWIKRNGKNQKIYSATFEDISNLLIDFNYSYNSNNGVYTITGWKGTYNGEPSTKIIIPNHPNIKW